MSYTSSRLWQQFEKVQQLRRQGHASAAEILTRQIIEAVPTSVDDIYCQGSLMLAWNRPADALRLFDNARLRGAVPPELLVDRAIALKDLGNFDDALTSCTMALATKPGFAPAHLVRADCLRDMGRNDEALGEYARALKMHKNMLPALRNSADLLCRVGRLEQALAVFNQLLLLLPEDPSILSGRGNVLAQMERFDECIANLDKALLLNPRNPAVWHNRGVALWNMERFEEALASYDKALALDPRQVSTLSTRANALQDMMRLDEAIAVHDRVVAMAPDFASGHWNRGQGLLLREKWKEGFLECEWRKRRPESAAFYQFEGRKEWLGKEDISGKTLLIHGEQGFGDMFQFVRYASLAQARGARVILVVRPALAPIFRESLVTAPAAVFAIGEALPDFDFHIFAMSLPLAFGTHLDNVPASVPYLRADTERAAVWGETLGIEGFKIGICWRGGGRDQNDTGRAFSPSLLAPVAALAGVRLINLQKGVAAMAQLRDLPMKVETLTDFDGGDGDFRDTAAIMANCNLVISSDTAVAHLAGALGYPVWLALKYVPDWRWRLSGVTTPWYPTMRLFRQKIRGDWSDVFSDIQDQLQQLLIERIA